MSAGRLFAILICLVMGAAVGVRAQSIFTVAGGADLDGRPAIAFPLTTVLDVAVDSQGNLFIVDSESFRVRKVSVATGILTTVAGNGVKGSAGDGGPATAAAIEPVGVAVDHAGNVFIADGEFFNSTVRRVDVHTGIIMTVAGGGHSRANDIPATERELGKLEDIALDSAGNLYIAASSGVLRVDAVSGRIRVIAGTEDPNAGLGDGGPATASKMPYAKDVVLDEAAGKMYIADMWNRRVRRVDLSTGIIDTLAGGGSSYSGDGVPATSVSIPLPDAVSVSPSGDVFVADSLENQVWRIETSTGLIRRYAGKGGGFSGDGGPATNASLNGPSGLSIDSAGNLFIADSKNGRVRRVVPAGTIVTVAGAGSDQGFQVVGDGGPATAATLFTSGRGSLFVFNGVAFDASHNLYIADTDDHRIRKLDLEKGIIATVAGDGKDGTPRPGPATQTSLHWPGGIAADLQGAVFFSDDNGVVYRIEAATGMLAPFAGGGGGADGGPASQATLTRPAGLALDRSGNLFIAEQSGNRVRRVDRATGVITTYAGTGTMGRSGDGGPATLASVGSPVGVVVAANGDLYITQFYDDVIRKVEGASGVITTVAGSGWPFYQGDGVPATQTGMGNVAGVGVDRQGNLYFSEPSGSRLHTVRASTGILWTLAGQRKEIYDYLPTYTGDNGPATAASLGKPEGMAVTPDGDIYFVDTNSNRVRVIHPCRTVVSTVLISPANGSSGVSLGPRLQWSAVPSAFHYDVLLDTVNPPQHIVATDVAAPTYNPSNLEPLTTYYWKVVAKGDPFCIPFSTASSEVFSFTTTGSCSSPAPFTGNATVSGAMATITWQGSARASFYDLYVGTSSPPRIYTRGATATTQTIIDLAPGTTHNWKVVAHASRDAARTVETSVGSFTTAGNCGGAGAFNATSPVEVTRPCRRRQRIRGRLRPVQLLMTSTSALAPILRYLTGIEGTSVMIPRLSPRA